MVLNSDVVDGLRSKCYNVVELLKVRRDLNEWLEKVTIDLS